MLQIKYMLKTGRWTVRMSCKILFPKGLTLLICLWFIVVALPYESANSEHFDWTLGFFFDKNWSFFPAFILLLFLQSFYDSYFLLGSILGNSISFFVTKILKIFTGEALNFHRRTCQTNMVAGCSHVSLLCPKARQVQCISPLNWLGKKIDY